MNLFLGGENEVGNPDGAKKDDASASVIHASISGSFLYMLLDLTLNIPRRLNSVRQRLSI